MDPPGTRAIALEIPRLRKLKGAYGAGALLKKTTALALENNGCFAVLQYSRSVQTYLDLATIDRPPFLNVHISHYAAVDLLHRTVHSGAMPKQNKYIYGALQTGRLKKRLVPERISFQRVTRTTAVATRHSRMRLEKHALLS